jgi:hypothetical protein
MHMATTNALRHRRLWSPGNDRKDQKNTVKKEGGGMLHVSTYSMKIQWQIKGGFV